jgi:hypothetical protein
VKVSFSRLLVVMQEYRRGPDEPGGGGPTGEVQEKPLVLNCGPAGVRANEPALIAADALVQEIPVTRRLFTAALLLLRPTGALAWIAGHAV